jgi:hypothetical protein
MEGRTVNRHLTKYKFVTLTLAVMVLLLCIAVYVFHRPSPQQLGIQHPQVSLNKGVPVLPPVHHVDQTVHTPTFTGNVVDTSNPLRRKHPLAGVWDPSRLKVINACMTISGTVQDVIHEPSDADYHMNLRPDAKYMHLLNTFNNSLVHGNMVVEIIPLDQGRVPIPTVGEHITVTGAYVLDTLHGWMEIHPAWLINGKGSVTYTQSQLQQSMKEISASYKRLVRSSTIMVKSSNLNVYPGQDASLTVKTVPGAAGTIKVVYSPSNVVVITVYADEDGKMTFLWHVSRDTKPGNYPVLVKLYTHSAKLVLQVKASVV